MVNKKYVAIYFCLAMIPIIALAIQYPALPEMVAVRNNGQRPDDFENKIHLWLIPTINLIVAVVAMFIPSFDKMKISNVSTSVAEKVFVIVLLLFNGVFALELTMARGELTKENLGMTVLVIAIIPIIFITVIGLISSKKRHN